ncbi:hypothetical protein ACQ5SK_07955 [Bradyrhizobium japonicum]
MARDPSTRAIRMFAVASGSSSRIHPSPVLRLAQEIAPHAADRAGVAFDDLGEFRVARGLREAIQIEDLSGTKSQAGFLDIDEQRLDHVGAAENFFELFGRPRETEVDHRLDDRHLARKVVIEVPGLMPASVQMSVVLAPRKPSLMKQRIAAPRISPRFCSCLTGRVSSNRTSPFTLAPFSTTVRHEKIKIREFHLFILTDVARRDSGY